MIKGYRYLIIITFTVLFCLFSFYLFPVNQAEMNIVVGESVKTLDSRFSYSYSDVNDLFYTLGDSGADIYMYITSVIDMIYPIVYGVLFILILSVVLLKRSSVFRFTPIVAVAFDYAENINTLLLLNRYPAINEWMVIRGSVFTLFKWIGVILTLGIIVISLCVRLLRWIKVKNG